MPQEIPANFAKGPAATRCQEPSPDTQQQNPDALLSEIVQCVLGPKFRGNCTQNRETPGCSMHVCLQDDSTKKRHVCNSPRQHLQSLREMDSENASWQAAPPARCFVFLHAISRNESRERNLTTVLIKRRRPAH